MENMLTGTGKSRYLKYAVLALTVLAVFYAYLSTMNPVFKNNDSPETAAAACTLGIGHPPGYPLYTMASKVFTLLPLANRAFRVNLFAAFLAALVLVVTYFVSGRLLLVFQNNPVTAVEGAAAGSPAGSGRWSHEISKFCTVLILAFSFIFWNQAVEAKGGIYILNLLFFSIMVYSALLLFERFHIKYFYLLSFIFGLSLANHWPSALIIAPAFVYFFVIYFPRLKPSRWSLMALFFLLGLSAYIYLPVRAANSPVLNWGNPFDLKGMLWVITRQAYVYPVKAGWDVLAYQFLEFVKFFNSNYFFLWIFSFAGGYALYKRSKKHFWFLLSLFLTVVFMVVVYNRTKKDIIWIIQLFLIPAEYIVLLLLLPGITLAAGLAKNKYIKYSVTVVAAVLIVVMALVNFSRNNYSGNYISYDYGRNILGSMPERSLYLADGDYNAMPVYYIQEIEKKRKDIRFGTASFFIFKWGIDDFAGRCGVTAQMAPFKRDQNIRNTIDFFIDEGASVFRNYFWENPVSLDPAKYIEQQYGVLLKVNRVKEPLALFPFALYCYRGIFDRKALYDPANVSLVTWYPACMVNAASSLLAENRPEESAFLGNLALLFPVEKPEGNILYNISLAYNRLDKPLKEMQTLKKSVDKKTNIAAAYERLGVLYYNFGLLDKSLDMFKAAQRRGSVSDMTNKAISNIEGFNGKDRLEIALMKANEKLLNSDYDSAMEIFNFLLEKHYKNDIIFKNLGVYHFRTGDYVAALDLFLKSKNETLDPGTFYYIAATYAKTGKIDNAIIELEEGVVRFPQDKGLQSYLLQLKEFKDKNGKDTDSADRPR